MTHGPQSVKFGKMPKSRPQYLSYDRCCLVGDDFKISDFWLQSSGGNYVARDDTIHPYIRAPTFHKILLPPKST